MASKKINYDFSHNLKDLLGQMLIQTIEEGDFDPVKSERFLQDYIDLNLNMGYGEYGINLNTARGDGARDYKVKLTKEIF